MMQIQKSDVLCKLLLMLLCMGFGVLHVIHVSTLFENDTHFSHLSQLEREMTFRTELGFYYYFYKKLVEVNGFTDGIVQLLNDNVTQYPVTVNAIQQYNIYPELIISGLFRLFDSFTSKYDIETKSCWVVDRGGSLTSVTSCVGVGDPTYFYLYVVWCCAGLTVAVMFLYAVVLSKSVLGGVVAALCFLYNHSHCTRIQWTPTLRESFAYPFCVLQMLAVTCYLSSWQDSSQLHTFKQGWILSICTLLCLLLWQFSQFMLSTQVIALLLMFCCGVIPKKTLLVVVVAQLVALVQAFLLLFKNELVAHGILNSLLLAILLVIGPSKTWYTKGGGVGMLGVTALTACIIKVQTSQAYGHHDTHVLDILLSKLTGHQSFHSLLYTKSAEFDWLPVSTLWELTATGLVPAASVALCLLAYHHVRQQPPSAHVVYNVLQLFAFTIMAVFVMRLKLFWTPQLCIVSSLVMSPKVLPVTKPCFRFALLVALLAAMSWQGVANLYTQHMVKGEFSNVHLEETLTWISARTEREAVFAGSMADMANILLSTGRPVVNNPHYEHPLMREKTKKVYLIFSRREVREVYSALVAMRVDYLLVNKSWCWSRRVLDIWDAVDAQQDVTRPSVCEQLLSGNTAPFYKVFNNKLYLILSLRTHTQTIALPHLVM